ncbi:MAG: HEAT repeat domain-containing protein [Chloroflexi bacterium]|nr:HEAT repeat domain-containing protein [Chloroflexota bacterium]
MTRRLADILVSIGENEKFNYQALSNLSDLNAQEMAQFKAAWSRYSLERRQKLMRTLVELSEERIEYDYRPIFRWALRDADPLVRIFAIEGLWEDENPALIPILHRMLREDEEAAVRAAAALGLGRFVQWHELGALETEFIEEITQALWDSFQNESEYLDVRRRALEAIATSSRPGVERLIEQAFYMEEIPMRASALYAMGQNADTRWIPYLLPELERVEAELRLEAARSLGELEARPAVRPLIHLIAVESDLEVRLAAIAALGQIGGDEARRALEAALEWEDEAVAQAAEDALDELHHSLGSDFELIESILGLEADHPETLWPDDFTYDDPLESELRRLLSERDPW